MLKQIASALVLTLALGGAACNKDEAKPAEKKAEPAAKTEEKKPEADKKPEDPAKAAGGALSGVDMHAFTGAGGSLDGMANFGFGGGGDAKAACEQYGKDVGSFLSQLQTEYQTLQDTMDSKGPDALDRFGQFLVKGAGELKNVKVDNSDLSAAHSEFVSGIETMGQGFVDAAAGVRARDEAATNKALEKVQSGANNTKSAFGKMSTVCGG